MKSKLLNDGLKSGHVIAAGYWACKDFCLASSSACFGYLDLRINFILMILKKSNCLKKVNYEYNVTGAEHSECKVSFPERKLPFSEWQV